MNFKLTRAVKGLLIACFAGFIIQKTVDQFFGGNLLGWLGLVPSAFAFQFRFWQIFTYAFLHADVTHLFLNLMMLAFVGGEIEALWGARRFLVYYFACSTAAATVYLVIQGFIWGGSGYNAPLVGASGGIYGLLTAYGILFAERSLLFMMVFPMKAKQFVWVLVGLEFLTTVFATAPGSALSGLAHLGGLAGGFVFLWGQAQWRVYSRKKAGGTPGGTGGRKSRRSSSSHLKLVISHPEEKDRNKKSSQSASVSSLDRLGAEDDSDSAGPKTWH